MVESQEANHVHQLAQKALQANREHQRALNAYIERLEAELQMVERLIDAANIEMEDDSDLDVPGFVLVPGAVRAAGAIPSSELLSPDSPFRDDALRRNRYKSLTDNHPMKARELDALAEAVRTENYRKMAFDAQILGLPTSHDMSERSPKSLERNCEGLDWDRIAEKVEQIPSSVSMATRTARECEIRWLGDRHPDFNHGPWNEGEISRLKSLIAGCRDGSPDWSDIAQKLGTNRTPLDCMRHGTTRKNHGWTPASDDRLIKAVHMLGHNWPLVARYVSEDATPMQCSTRYQRSLDPSVKRVNWTPEEDARLQIAAGAYGQSWVDVAAAMPGRTNDQCRDRWNEQVNPNVNRNPWSPEEDKALLDVVRENENVAWKEVSKLLGTGRTDAMCRNRYLTLQREKFPPVKFKVSRHPSCGF
ncbi:Homeodomain-like protein [Pisolithus marmoratus]|nr:Homeodomain-like protein [Pisolithus marmoratus]